MNIAGIIGILGFVLAAVTFGLTRWERRRELTIYLLVDHGTRFRDEIGEENEDDIIVAQIINTGLRPVVIDRDSFSFIGDGKLVKWYQLDFFGRENLPAPLNPGERAEVGIFVESFASLVHAMSSSQVPISVELRDTSGRRYQSPAKYTLLLEVNEISKKS